MSDLHSQAEALLGQMDRVPPREAGESLRAADEARILQLAAQGVTQTDIARAVGCHQSTVSRTLAEYDDSRRLARKFEVAFGANIADDVEMLRPGGSTALCDG